MKSLSSIAKASVNIKEETDELKDRGESRSFILFFSLRFLQGAARQAIEVIF